MAGLPVTIDDVRHAATVIHRRVRRTPVIYFDNEYSQRYTVLELVADDAPGLLHRVSRRRT